MSLTPSLILILNVFICCVFADDEIQTVLTDTHFQYYLGSSFFSPHNYTGSGVIDIDAEFQASLFSRPELPTWISLIKGSGGDKAFLCGTPLSVDSSVTLQIVGVERNTMQSAVQKLDINVIKRRVLAKNLIAMHIVNLGMAEVVDGGVLDELLKSIHILWPRGGDIYIKEVASAGKLKSLPSFVENESQKDGVQVIIGGTGSISNELLSAAKDLPISCSIFGDDFQPDIAELFPPNITIKWCSMRLFELESLDQPMSKKEFLNDDMLYSDVEWKTSETPRKDYSLPFYIIVTFPLSVALILAILISICMFCCREGVDKRDENTPEEQLAKFNTIRSATVHLRLMSTYRETWPRLTSGNRSVSSPLIGNIQQEPLDIEPRPTTLPRNFGTKINKS